MTPDFGDFSTRKPVDGLSSQHRYKSLKSECIRPKTPLSLGDARRVVDQFVKCYNDERLHSAIGYITPKDKLLGNELVIFAERKRKLNVARERRTNRQKAAATVNPGVAYAFA
jgi:hypothetical protein